MGNSLHDRSETANGARPTPPGAGRLRGRMAHAPAAPMRPPPDPRAAGPATDPSPAAPPPARGAIAPLAERAAVGGGRRRPGVRRLRPAPTVKTMMETVSTDDAYVNGHVTYVAPRVAGQVSRVLVDDNDRVSKGDLLVQLDREPYQVQVDLKKAAVVNAEVDVEAARAEVRGILAQARSLRWKLQKAIEDVDDKVAQLKARVAALRGKEASLEPARADFARASSLSSRGAMAREEFDHAVRPNGRPRPRSSRLEEVHEARVAPGPRPAPRGEGLNGRPRRPQPDLLRGQRGVKYAAPEHDAGRVPARLRHPHASAGPRRVRPARQGREHRPHPGADGSGGPRRPAGRGQAPPGPARPRPGGAEPPLLRHRQRDRRRGDQPAASTPATTCSGAEPDDRPLVTEIWIDANFKETQLADLRIGQRVRCEVDMYGGRREFEGRITGFTMGTGQTLALLPPQNATGNFVKIVRACR